MPMALEGIKILDLSRNAPGPFCTWILADLGADVLRIEEAVVPSGRRVRQEGSRYAETVWSSRDDPRATAHDTLGRNKRSMALNLKTEKGRAIFHRLAMDADVVVEEFRPGVAKRLGIDYETLRSKNPKIIYCAITGYGQDGPYRDLPGHDVNYISLAGALGLIGESGSRPVIPLNLLGDYAGGGMNAVIGILSALIARSKTGLGQFVDVSMTDSVVSLLARVFSRYFQGAEIPKRGMTVHSGLRPQYAVYETKDNKYLSLACAEPWFWTNLCQALGRPDLIPYQDAEGSKREDIRQYLKEVFLAKTRDEWFELLKGNNDICVAPLNDLDDVCSDPQIRHRKMIIRVNHPAFGQVRQVGIALKLSETPGSVRETSPLRGQHTDEVLRTLGYSDEEIGLLRQTGVVR